jgi:hypothetical protein
MLAGRILEALVFGRPGRVLAVLVPLGLLGWIAIKALGGRALVVAIAVPGLAGPIALVAWITGDLTSGSWRATAARRRGPRKIRSGATSRTTARSTT